MITTASTRVSVCYAWGIAVKIECEDTYGLTGYRVKAMNPYRGEEQWYETTPERVIKVAHIEQVLTFDYFMSATLNTSTNSVCVGYVRRDRYNYDAPTIEAMRRLADKVCRATGVKRVGRVFRYGGNVVLYDVE